MSAHQIKMCQHVGVFLRRSVPIDPVQTSVCQRIKSKRRQHASAWRILLDGLAVPKDGVLAQDIWVCPQKTSDCHCPCVYIAPVAKCSQMPPCSRIRIATLRPSETLNHFHTMQHFLANRLGAGDTGYHVLIDCQSSPKVCSVTHLPGYAGGISRPSGRMDCG